jgi:hypothetical protein
VEVFYYTPREVATLLHVSVRLVWRNCSEGRWPHLRSAGHYYMNPDDVARVVVAMRVDPDAVPVFTDPPRLGLAIDPDESEGVQ